MVLRVAGSQIEQCFAVDIRIALDQARHDDAGNYFIVIRTGQTYLDFGFSQRSTARGHKVHEDFGHWIFQLCLW